MFSLEATQVQASLIGDEERFQQYIQSSIIEATINKDILMDTPISKPALLKQTFELGVAYSGENPLTKQDAWVSARCGKHIYACRLYKHTKRKRDVVRFAKSIATTKQDGEQVFQNSKFTIMLLK